MGAEIVIGGWSFVSDFDVHYCSDPMSTQSVPGYTSAYNPGMRSFEVKIPWSKVYPGTGGTVSDGAVMRIVAVSIGGDNSGAYDAAPNSSNDAGASALSDPGDAGTDVTLSAFVGDDLYTAQKVTVTDPGGTPYLVQGLPDAVYDFEAACEKVNTILPDEEVLKASFKQ
jgi:hypothetical protein